MADAYGSHPRKEDARLIRGQGAFIDDISLPGMLHAAILRSPLAHARIVQVDATAAVAHPKVATVLTGSDLTRRDLAWMPTLSGDSQAVLATDKVRFQGQEVAFVVATDRYAARDALELIEVDKSFRENIRKRLPQAPLQLVALLRGHVERRQVHLYDIVHTLKPRHTMSNLIANSSSSDTLCPSRSST